MQLGDYDGAIVSAQYDIMSISEMLPRMIVRRQSNEYRTYLEGTMVRMMRMMKLWCVNHVASLRILAPGWLRDLDVARGGNSRFTLCTRGLFRGVLFLLLHFRLRFLRKYSLYCEHWCHCHSLIKDKCPREILTSLALLSIADEHASRLIPFLLGLKRTGQFI